MLNEIQSGKKWGIKDLPTPPTIRGLGDIPPTIRGLGDVVHAIAIPIARLFRLPCVDPKTGQLRPNSPCARRQAALNSKSIQLWHSTRALLNRLIPFRRPSAKPPR